VEIEKHASRHFVLKLTCGKSFGVATKGVAGIADFFVTVTVLIKFYSIRLTT
jgi:hypothetical protein